jgi:hypothetical protein
MQAKAYRHLWGYPITSDATFRQIRDDGYIGIETGMPNIASVAAFGDALKRYGLEFIGQVYTAEFTKGHSVDEHLATLETEARKLLPLKPLLLNIHSGEDTWSLEQMHQYFRRAAKIEVEIGIPFAHETHRGRCLFHPAISRMLLSDHPEIKVVADLSHWVCVCERLLEDQGEAISLAAERALYVHTRIGYAQGPQVSDPRAEMYSAERAAHEGWWEIIFRSMRRRALPAFAFCPEFGPPPYLPVLPFTAMPVADLVSVCNWQAARIRELVNQWQAVFTID